MIITLNNKEIEVFKGEKLIEAAGRNGIEIPSLCYAAGYKHQSSCMVCMVKNCKTGQFIPSCSTKVEDRMIIDSESDEVKNLRRQSLELLLSDHMAVCKAPCVPDKCKLRRYATAYRAKWNRYQRYSALRHPQQQHIKDDLWFDVSKCIRCGLCVYNSNDGFTFRDRGFGMRVVLPQESIINVDKTLWEICPTQALYSV